MSNIPRKAEDFYRRRDDRTNLCVVSDQYQKRRCLITVDNEIIGTHSGQVLLETSARLVSRWCRTVDIEMPSVRPHVRLRSAQSDLGDHLISVMEDADPFGHFSVVECYQNVPDLHLHLGPYGKRRCGETIFVNTSGWLVAVGRSKSRTLPEPSNSENCLGAIAGACIGVSEVFKAAVGLDASLRIAAIVFDLFNLHHYQFDETELRISPFPSDLNFGNALMVGGGSVGSGAIFCLVAAGAKGTITLIDKDIVKVENINRSPIFDRRNVGLAKVEAIDRFCSGSTVLLSVVDDWWDDFVREGGLERPRPFDLWLPLANEFDVRRSIQSNYPPLMIHASTTQNWGVNHGRHVPGQDDCLVDRFPNDVGAAVLKCSSATIKQGNVTLDAALPFTSLFAGVLITAELVRLQIPGYPEVDNFAHLDLGGSFEQVQMFDKSPRSNCLCQSQSVQINVEINGFGLYSGLLNG